MLTPSEESFLNAFMKALYKINPSLHNKLSRIRELVSLLGCWDGVYFQMLEI